MSISETSSTARYLAELEDESQDRDVRYRAALGLTSSVDERVEQVLLRTVLSNDELVRAGSVAALGKVGTPEDVLGALLNMLLHDPSNMVKEFLAGALADLVIRYPAEKDHVAEVLHSQLLVAQTSRVKCELITALGKIKYATPDFLALLRELYEEGVDRTVGYTAGLVLYEKGQ